jgi:hypothetical protein
MRLRKAPYTVFKRISKSLDDFSPLGTSPIYKAGAKCIIINFPNCPKMR